MLGSPTSPSCLHPSLTFDPQRAAACMHALQVRHAMDFWRLAVPLPAPFDPASAGLEESELSE